MAAASPPSYRAVLLISCILFFIMVSQLDPVDAKLRKKDCKPKCTYRCSATSHKKPCMFFCLKCCATCLCVPPGVYGNKQTCPCYNNWKTKEGRPKCP